jgi:NAD(P)-dependent dehydrogenase (short-subunit alcohol dehydrogenase family)
MQSGSVIANVSSVLSRIDSMGPAYTAYAPAKALQNAFTVQLAASLRRRGVITFAVHPGWVATDIGGRGAPVSASDAAQGIADMILMASAKDSGTFRDYTGRGLHF